MGSKMHSGKSSNVETGTVDFPMQGNDPKVMQGQLQKHKKGDDSSNNQLVESRMDCDDWSARFNCNDLFQIPQDWTFFSRAGSFENAEASICGMELCSIGSLGGGSLCNVFIEDDPQKQTAVTEVKVNKDMKIKP